VLDDFLGDQLGRLHLQEQVVGTNTLFSITFRFVSQVVSVTVTPQDHKALITLQDELMLCANFDVLLHVSYVLGG
jgi:hypothetical protein